MGPLERLLPAVARQAPHFIGVADAGLRPIYVNEASRRMVGLPPGADLSGTTIPDFVVPDERGLFRDIVLPCRRVIAGLRTRSRP